LLNVVTILAGSALGILIGSRFSANIQQSVVTGLGLVTLVLGVQNASQSGNILVPLLSLVIGTIIGEVLDVDGRLKAFGAWLQVRFANGKGDAESANTARLRFISGFVTASLVFGVGPMAVLGALQNGIDAADIRLLAIKSTLDFFASIAFAASLGIGVAFSALPIFVIQGGFALTGMFLAESAGAALGAESPLIRELTASGGLILMGLALVLLDVKQPRVANMLPALIVAPLIVLGAALLGVPIYP
ncbi:MAG: DUF554 domain-containing protein, partial [Anaerolineae bacterium]|nr:DUF554 domain-containing protein [Anaerolineae bacterium]